MSRLNRRRFLKTSAAVAGSALALGRSKLSANVLGANDRVRVAVAGLNGRGKSHMDAFASMKGVEVAYVVDPDSRIYDRAIKQVSDKGGNTPQAVTDIRTALDDDSINAISVATPNHWHSLMTIWGCQAGKDVYVEKPMSHNIHEGRIAVETARKHNRIVQHGTQSRSNSGWAKVMAALASEKYGKLKVARGFCYKQRDSIEFAKPSSPPAGLDFNIWLGPAPQQSYHSNLVHYNWHWFWDTGNGDIGNQGVHEMDLARWGTGQTLPKSVIALGGRFGYEDQGQTANTQIAIFDYGDVQLIFDVRGLPTQRKVTSSFETEQGTIEMGEKGPAFIPRGSSQGEPLADVEASVGPGDGHFVNFIEAVKSRGSSDLNAPILEGHYSAALCHLANISYRLGEQTAFDAQTKAFAGNPAASEAFEKMEEHLAKGNGVKLESTNYRLGRHLSFDGENERFANDAEADKMLTRQYREPFVVPESVA